MSSASNIISNFEYQISQISPTSTTKRELFAPWDVSRNEEPSKSSFRKYWIDWQGSDEDEDGSNANAREAHHRFMLNVSYPVTLPHNTLTKLVLDDRHDLCKRLRDHQYVVGIAGATTQDVGIIWRKRIGDDIDKKTYEDCWILMIQFEIKAIETE